MKDSKHRHSRREFIGAAAGACAYSALAPSLVHARDLKDYPAYYLGNKIGQLDGPKPLAPTRVYPDMDQATVGMAGITRNKLKGLDFEKVLAAVREVVEAAGGLDEIEPGQRVMIKPNIVGPIAVPGERITTNPLVVRAVIRLVKERGAHAMVGDQGIRLKEMPFLTALTWRMYGIARACKREGAEAYPWHLSEYVWFHPNKRHWSKGFRFPKILQDVDHFINVPILKNHETTTAQFTCCMKAYVGLLHPEDRGGQGLDKFHENNISEKIAELNMCVKPLINIVDATRIMLRGGPGDGIIMGDPTYKVALFDNADLVLASKDRVACDSTALSVLKLHAAEKGVKREYVGKSVRDQVQLYYGAQLGLGQCEPDQISIEDIKVPRLDEIKANWV